MFTLENTKGCWEHPLSCPWDLQMCFDGCSAVWEAAWRRQQQNGRDETLKTVVQISEFNLYPDSILGKNEEQYHSVIGLSALSLLLFFIDTFYGLGEFYKILKGWSKWNLCGSLHQFRATAHASFSQVIAVDFSAVNRVLSLHITYRYTHSWVWCSGGD